MKRIDPIEVKQAIKDGQLEVFENQNRIYLRDGDCGDTVCIYERFDKDTNVPTKETWDGEYYGEGC